ncbi:MAG: histidine phosphatase family protein, partial [bacterium]|nr:histidine phosphatase family protein [bacterium]
MKSVYIVRHAPKDNITGELTDEGRLLAKSLQEKYTGFFDQVIASEIKRTQETAYLLTNIHPRIDPRANIMPFSDETYEKLREKSKLHSQRVTGVMYEDNSLANVVHAHTIQFINMIKETHKSLAANQRALICSHDVTMVPAYQTLKYGFIQETAQQFKPLSGFIYAGDSSI